jgi:hypothetical protein
MDNTIDTDNPPSEITLPSNYTADLSQLPQPTDSDGGSGAQTMISFPFCFLYNQRPWGTVIIAAPSPELAALTAGQLVDLINKQLVDLKYPPVCTARGGEC